MLRNKSSKASFKGQTIHIGIDNHKKDNQLTFYLNGERLQTVRRPSSGTQILDYLHTNFPDAIYKSAYEAGFSGFSLHRYLQENGVDNIVVHPADIPKSDKDRDQKTDKRDANQIAKCLAVGLLQGIYVPSRDQQAIRDLVRQRKSLVKALTAIKCRIRMWFYFVGQPLSSAYANDGWSNRFVTYLDNLQISHPIGKAVLSMFLDQLKQYRQWLLQVNRTLRHLSKEPQYHTNYNLLLSVSGIGMVGAWTILSEIGDTTRFRKESQLISYAGLRNNSNDSGEKQSNGRITRRCNQRLRVQLIESAWIAVRTDPALALFFQKQKERKHKNKAIICVARKLLCRIRAVLKNQTRYERGLA